MWMRAFMTLLVVLVLQVGAAVGAGGAETSKHPAVRDAARLFEAWAEAQLRFRGQPSISVGVIHDQTLVYAKGFGYRDVEKKIPATPDTIYRIGSITKLFTATAILQLRDAGKLSLDDPVSKHLPWFEIATRFEDSRPITIRHLLTHTSGLPRESAYPSWTTLDFPTREELFEGLKRQEAAYAPETRWKYSNLALSIAGEIVAAVSGKPYEQYIQEKILDPLGMQSTSVVLPESHRSRLATAYGFRRPDGGRSVWPVIDIGGFRPAGNMSSTAEDLARFVSFQLREDDEGPGAVLRRRTRLEMRRPHWVRSDWSFAWGLGFGIRRAGGKTLVGHTGWVSGHVTDVTMDTDQKLGVIILTNADDSGVRRYEAAALALFGPAVKKALEEPDMRAPEADPAWAPYIGDYAFGSGAFDWGLYPRILPQGEKLKMYLPSYDPGGDPTEDLIDLEPEGAHRFRMTGENGNGEILLFEMNEDGSVKRAIFEGDYLYPR